MTEHAPGTATQLSLVDTPRSWKLDERTREVGFAGIARARAALRAGMHARGQASGGPPPAAARAAPRPRAA